MVKSPPELWAECSNAASLARHLGQFGEIRITKLEPETAVAWEGSAARGTVRLEPAGWGTKVFLTATEAQAHPDPALAAQAAPEPEPPEPEPEPPGEEPEPPGEEPEHERLTQAEPEPASLAQAEPEQAAEPKVEPTVRRGFFARLMARFQPAAVPSELDPPPGPESAAESEPAAGERAAAGSPPPAAAESPPPAAAESPPPAAAESPPPAAAESSPPAGSSPPAAAGSSPAANPLDAALDSLGSAHHRPYSRA